MGSSAKRGPFTDRELKIETLQQAHFHHSRTKKGLYLLTFLATVFSCCIQFRAVSQNIFFNMTPEIIVRILFFFLMGQFIEHLDNIFLKVCICVLCFVSCLAFMAYIVFI